MRKRLKYGKKQETVFQESVLKYLYTLPNIVVHNNVGSVHNSGISDVTGCYKGRYFALELKIPKGIKGEHQKAYIDKVLNAGGLAGFAETLEKVKEVLEIYE